MVVKTQSTGRGETWLHIGAENVRRNFSPQTARIQLMLDHVVIECGLGKGFFNGSPEIRDPRLCLWLEAKRYDGNAGRQPAALVMSPAGDNAFRIEPIPAKRKPLVAALPPTDFAVERMMNLDEGDADD